MIYLAIKNIKKSFDVIFQSIEFIQNYIEVKYG